MSAKDLIDDISDKLDELKTLDIRTVVGDWDLDKHKPKGDAKIIISRIDLLDGDITTAFGEEFLDPPLDKIREYHAEREKKGMEIIDGNIKALKELVELAIQVIRSKKKSDDLTKPPEGGTA
jgi:hypothetical protein